jgi:beta-lactamase regulating signal transducer with metallopeptidase domain
MNLDAFGRDLAAWILAANVWTAVVLVAVLLADRVLRRVVSPTGRMLLFAIVFARLLVPMDFASPLGLAPAVESASLLLPEVAAAPAMSSTSPTSSITTEPTRELAWGLAVIVVYAIGMLALGIAFAQAHGRLRRTLVEGGRERDVPGGPPVIEHGSAGPFALGGRVVIPRRLFRELAPHELHAVARHERAHLRHRDPLLVACLTALCVIAWPIVAVWIAAHRIRFLIELRADATAIADLDAAGRDAYRRVVLRVAALGWRTPMHATGFGPVTSLEARLAALGGIPKGPLWLQLGTTATIATAVLCCAARGESEPEESAPTHAEPANPEPDVACAIPIRGVEHEPTDPALVEASKRLRSQLATVDSAAAASRIVEEASRLGLRRVRAEARLVLGQHLAASGAREDAKEQLGEAAWDAASAGHDGIAAVAASELVTLLLAMGDADAALAWHTHHVAARRRVAGDGPLPREDRMLVALIAHYEARGEPQPELQARLDRVREACK